MPRPRSHSVDDLTAAAMAHFWAHGYGATSMEDLVAATGVSRHGIYAAFKDKRGLFRAALEAYRDAVVTPAFARVEAPGADLAAVAAYYETQIARAEAAGLPGPGCLVVNTQTEPATHDPAVLDLVAAHNARLHAGFLNALANAPLRAGADLPALADTMVVFTQGLWATSRTVTDAAPLRRAVANFLSVLTQGPP